MIDQKGAKQAFAEENFVLFFIVHCQENSGQLDNDEQVHLLVVLRMEKVMDYAHQHPSEVELECEVPKRGGFSVEAINEVAKLLLDKVVSH